MASALLILFLTSLFALNSTAMRMLRSASETADASQLLQTRVEQVRLANWTQVTRADWVQENLLPTRTQAAAPGTLVHKIDTLNDLQGARENVEVAVYPPAAGSDAFTVSRDESGNVSNPGGDLSAKDQVCVHLTVSWTSWGGRTRSRELSTIVSRWGISK